MILITGQQGFIGRKLAAKLPDAFGIDLQDGQNLLTADLPKNVDTIYHLAAQSSVEGSWHDPVHDSMNLAMTVRLAHAYPEAKIVFAQSAASVNPASPYGFSKWVSGEYLKKFHKNSVICVFPNVYGGTKSVVDIFKDKDEVVVFGDGMQVRDYVHVDDIVEGLLQAQNWPVGEYFMGSMQGTTVLELACEKRIVFAPARKEARESVLPNTTPNWKPSIEVLDYLYA